MTTTVVFAYHDVGVRCLSVLVDQGLRIPLVLTHRDDPQETLWFSSVEAWASERHIPVLTPERRDLPALVPRLRELAPDLIFSFYYRYLIPPAILEIPRLGAYNMHGSLLPRYRGRAPVNWAILHGERETGASLHVMEKEADAGRLIDQMAVPILLDDTAREVMTKVTVAAEIVLLRSLSDLVRGRAQGQPLDLRQGSYFGRRRPEDGRIDWTASARQIHNLVRAVAPPYPGAFTQTPAGRLDIHRTRLDPEPARYTKPMLYSEGEMLYVDCGDGARLEVLKCSLEGSPYDARRHRERWEGRALPLGDASS